MEAWNREELYKEIWEQPMLKLAPKYGISSVMLGKVCRKLRIPVPGRGYWARKESGKPVGRKPLSTAKNLPIVHRFKTPPTGPPTAEQPASEPNDPEYLRIKEIESRTIHLDAAERRHPLVVLTARAMKGRDSYDKGRVHSPRNELCLRLLVSKESLDRALAILNGIVTLLKKEGFQVSNGKENQNAVAKIFGQDVAFEIVEKYRQLGMKETKSNYGYVDRSMQYELAGLLEFRVGDRSWGGIRVGDGKARRLENEISTMLGALMREARAQSIRAESRRQEEIRRRQRDMERYELSNQIQEEEKRVANLDSWVKSWVLANQHREFIAAFEKAWAESGHDLTAESEKGKRLLWMKQQADRLDPLVVSPPSILDRKSELNRY
jgi:hypothetical protein